MWPIDVPADGSSRVWASRRIRALTSKAGRVQGSLEWFPFSFFVLYK